MSGAPSAAPASAPLKKQKSVRILPPLSVQLDRSADAVPIMEQMKSALATNSQKLLDLFRPLLAEEVTREDFHMAGRVLGLETDGVREGVASQ